MLKNSRFVIVNIKIMATAFNDDDFQKKPARRESISDLRRRAIVADNVEENESSNDDYKEERMELYSMEDIRLKTKKFLTHSKFGYYYENILLIISVASSIEYICQTYLDDNKDSQQDIIILLNTIEKVLAVVFMFDWSLNFFTADHKLVFVGG